MLLRILLHCCGLGVKVVKLLGELAADFECCAVSLLVCWLLCYFARYCNAKVAKVESNILPFGMADLMFCN